MTIAILEPDQDLLTLYDISLHEFGYDFKGFTHTRALLEYLDSNPTNIKFLILEYKLDNMMGCEIADKIYWINPLIKMAFVTGYNKIINNKLNLEIVMKPITLTKVLKLAKKYMESS